MLSLSFYKAMDTIFNRVLIPATVILSITVSVSASDVSASPFNSY